MRNETAYNQTWDEATDMKVMDHMSLASKGASKAQESTFASSFGYGMAAGAAAGAVAVFVLGGKSKTASDKFERV